MSAVTRMTQLAAIVVVLLLPCRIDAGAAGPVTVAWDANLAGDNVTGYQLSYGPAPGVYTTAVDVGNVTSVPIPTLVPGVRTYFTVQAYTAAGAFSPFSSEVSYTVPLPADPCAAQRTTIVVIDWTATVKVGDRGWVRVALNGPLPVVETQVRLGAQVIGGAKGDALLTDLRDALGAYFSVPRTLGVYPLTVATRDNRGCEVVTTAPRTVTVIP